MTKPDTNEIVDFLKKVPFFSEVVKAPLLQLCENTQLEYYDGKESILEKGDVADGMYEIVEGNPFL